MQRGEPVEAGSGARRKKCDERALQHSLAYWLDSTCKACAGTGRAQAGTCAACSGNGEAPIDCAGGFVRERVKDMVSELHNIAASQARLANRRLRSR